MGNISLSPGDGAILAVNSGSSSLKAALFLPDGSRRSFHYRQIGYAADAQSRAFQRLLDEVEGTPLAAVGHRVVHGGDAAEPARLADSKELARLGELVEFAPLHMPNNLAGLAFFAGHLSVPQFACYDTAFHRTMPALARRLPLPERLGLERYGFHGINFAHVARRLPALLPGAETMRIAVAHLGSGVSVTLLENLRSVNTTMGLTPLGGLPMGTRCGDLDPGVVLTLEQRMTEAEVTDMLYHGAGLLALSGGLSADMEVLLAAGEPGARFAVDYFCARVRGVIGAYAAELGGLDALAFTGGIGEHAPTVRAAICEPLSFLGFCLDPVANAANETRLQAADAKPVLVIPADEESMIAVYVMECLS